MDYYKYYRLYLNFKEEYCNSETLNINISTQRNIPMCKNYYHYIIYSEVKKYKILSVAPQFYELFENAIGVESNFINIFDYLLKKQFTDFNIRYMNRMGIIQNCFDYNGVPNLHNVVTLDKNRKKLFIDSLLKSNVQEDIAYEKWKNIKVYVDDGRWFAIVHNEKIISRAYVSDIDFNGGNISVWTDKQYLRCGYAKAVTAKAVMWCLKNNILPIYLVEKNNIASIKTAKSLGFTTLFKEIIVSKKIEI